MNELRWIAVVAVICSSVPAVFAEGRPAPGEGAPPWALVSPSGRNALEGTWEVQITVRQCETGAALRPPFQAMATFSRGGTVITSDSSIPPSVRSTGHGVWSHSGGPNYEAVVEAFLFEPSGAWSGTQRFMQTIEITGRDTIEVSVAAEISNAQGVVIGRGCASSTGIRLK